MRASSIGRGAAVRAALALLFGLGFGAPALAQQEKSTLINPPTESSAMSPGGVDLRNGGYAYNETDLAIGGEGGLTLSRTMSEYVPGHGNPFGNLSHNWDITLSEVVNQQLGDTTYRIRINFGGRSATFKSEQPSTGFAPEMSGPLTSLTYTGTRSSASVVYTYTAPDGSVAVFRPLGLLGGGDCSHLRRCAFIAQLTEADGTVYTFDYTPSGAGGGSQRLRSVTSSRGYALLFEGIANHVTKACAINLSLGALPSTCPANALASASYSYTASGAVRLAGATGPDNATQSFTYGTNGTMGFVRPGETSPWQTLALGEQADEQDMVRAIASQQSFASGLTYSYGYVTSPVTENRPNPSIAGGSYSYNDGQARTVEMPYAFPLLHGSGNPGSHCYFPPCGLEQPIEGPVTWVYQQTPGPIEIVDELGRTTTLNYCDPGPMAGLPPDEQNRCVVVPLVSFTDPEGAVTELLYDGARNVTRVTRRPRPGSTLAPIVTSAVYDTANIRSQNRPLSMTDANGNTTNFAYAPEHGGMLTVTGPAPSAGAPRPQTRHAYAQRQARRWDGAAAGPPVWLRVSTSTCRTSAATGSPASPCATAGDEVLTSYDYGPETGPNTLLLRGQAVTATDGGVATTLRTCYAYDALGRKLSETQPNANLASCPAGPPTTALPYTSSIRYDADGRVTGTIQPDPDGAGGLRHMAVRNSYDLAGRLVKVETGTLLAWQSESIAPANWSGFVALRSAETQYDMMSRKVREWVREGSVGAVRTMSEHSYDLAGRLTCTAVRMNPAAFAFTGTPNACLANAAGSGGPDRITRNVYDAAGQRLQLRVGVGSAIEGAEATWAYNETGQVTTMIDGNGNRAELRYDGHGRQDRWTFPGTTRPSNYNDASQATALATAGSVNPNDYEAYGYDAAGNRTSLRKRDGTSIGFAYDNLNRLTLRDLPSSPWYNIDRSYGYDLAGRMISASGNGTIGYGYDGFGRLISESGAFGTVGYSYDRNGNRTRLTYPGGALAIGYAYDGLGNLLEIRANPDGANSLLATYAYDGLGRRTLLTRGNGATTSYGYDALSRLSQIVHNPSGTNHDLTLGFGYNPASQIAQATRSNDTYAWSGHYQANRNYTPDGLNRYSQIGGVSANYDANGNLVTAGGATYGYNAENRLVIASGAKYLELIDDSAGRLHRYYDGSANRWMAYDGANMIAEYGAGGTLLRRFVHGPGTDEPLVAFEGANLSTPYYYHADGQGSVIALSNGAGSVAFVNSYDEYGIPAATNVGRFQYTGQLWLAELGMYHFKARAYSPYWGRFAQTDPIDYEDQFNLYAYVRNDPVNRTDPTGLEEDPRWTRLGLEGMAADARENPLSNRERAIVQTVVRNAPLTGPITRFFEVLDSVTSGGPPPSPLPGRASTLRPGSYAREGMPARGPSRNFTSRERQEMNRQMAANGCHTCGTRNPGTQSGNAIPDHQPPSALNPLGGAQRLFPQCDTCRRRQAGEVTQQVMRQRRQRERPE